MLSEVETRHRKQLAVMRGWLEGRRFYAAMDALEMVRLLEQGPRKDGCTPKFHHQLSIARLLTTLEPHFLFPEETITAGFLHDILEDHADQWTREALVDRYGKRIGDAVWLLTKKSAGMVKNYDAYFAEMSACPVASLVKLADRAHNLQTMQGVFSFDKQAAYISEVDTWFFPLLKTARRRFPKQYPAYENLKITLRNQTRLIRHIHAAAREARMQI